MNKPKLFVALLCTLVIISNGHAQISVTPCHGKTPQEVIDQVIIGNGVTITNVQFNGKKKSISKNKTTQLGTFTNNEKGFPGFFSSGIILCTGNCKIAEGPNNTGSATDGVLPLFPYKCKELENIVKPYSVNNPAVLEFDFSSVTKHVQFRYVFASEEYPEFSCSAFNDVFGFFVTDTKTNKTKNIALIPGTNKAVSVNNIHPDYGSDCKAVNAEYLTMLPDGSKKMQFNGYVGPFEAVVDLEPNRTYHIKLAISNVSDRMLESAVFIEAMSFNAVYDDGTIVKGVGSKSTFSRTDTLPERIAEGVSYDELKKGKNISVIALKDIEGQQPIDPERYIISTETKYDYFLDTIYARIVDDSIVVTIRSKGQWCDCFFPSDIPVNVVLTPKEKRKDGEELHRIVKPVDVPIVERSPWLVRCLWVLLTMAGLVLFLIYLWGLLKKNRFKKSGRIMERHLELNGSQWVMTGWKQGRRLREKGFIAWANRWLVPFRDERRTLNWTTAPPHAGSITFVAAELKNKVYMTRGSFNAQKMKMASFNPKDPKDKRKLLRVDPISIYKDGSCCGELKYDSGKTDDEKIYRIVVGVFMAVSIVAFCVLAFMMIKAVV